MTPLVSRHRAGLRADEVVTVDGIRCTSLARTVADVLRGAGEETAIALVDFGIDDAQAWGGSSTGA